MVAAEMDEVVQGGVAAVCPMGDVVGVEEAAPVAAREAASAVPAAHRAAQGRRDRAGLAPDRERLAVTFDETDDRGVARDPPRGLRGQRRAIFELRTAFGSLFGKRVGIDVHDDLMPVAAAALLAGRCRQCQIGERDERFRVARLRGDALVGRRSRGDVLSARAARTTSRALRSSAPSSPLS